VKAIVKFVDGSTREVTLYKRPLARLKRGPKSRFVTFPVNGNVVDVKVTDNKAWAGSGPWIEYPWFEIDGNAYWFSLGYNEPVGVVESVATAEGTATKMTARVTSRVDDEARRVALGRKTWYDNRGAAYPVELTAELVALGIVTVEEPAPAAPVDEPKAEKPKRGKKVEA
jgi:hypothetical protein